MNATDDVNVMQNFINLRSAVMLALILWVGESIYSNKIQLEKISIILDQYRELLEETKKDRVAFHALKQRVEYLEYQRENGQ